VTSPAPGTTIGPYTLGQPLGRGSTATVYLARRAEREVALKVRSRGDPELDRRFLREFEALRGLAVPGVVRVHDAGLDDRWLWYAMDVVRGAPIRTWIEAGAGTAERVHRLLHVAPPLCDALAGVHRAGLIHRDLKPSNVLVDVQGLPHVLDFGVARAWVDADPLTGQGGLVGTLPFMSPEQVAGQPLTPRSDIFAVGLMLYEGIVGKRPRPAKPQDWLRIQCMERPRPLATLDLAVPLPLSAVIDRMVALDPADRPDAATAAALLRACADGAGPPDWPEPHAYVGNPEVLSGAAGWLAGSGPRMRILVGPAGSGRRRTAEHIRRIALLAGGRTARGRCRVERPGGAIEELLEALLEAPADAAWRRNVGGDDTGPLLEMWPHLPLEPLPGPGVSASAQDVVRAASAALVRAAGGGLLLVVEHLDEVDRFTARLLDRLARVAPAELSVLCVVDDRHAGRRCQRLVAELQQLSLATLHRLPDLETADATWLARALVPEGVTISASPGSPLVAREAGLSALARARGVALPRLPTQAFAAALEDRPLHLQGWETLGVSVEPLVATGAVVATAADRARVGADIARAGALARMGRREPEARRLAEAWAKDPGVDRHAASARAALLADDTAAASAPAVRAAIEAERAGRLREARDWLVLVDALPRERESADYAALRFALAACRAGVAAGIGSERTREDLVASALSRASDEEERAAATLLAVDLAERRGDVRAALVGALKLLGRASPALAGRVAVRVARLRLLLGDAAEADAALARADTLRGGWRGDRDQVLLDALQADVAVVRGDLAGALALAQRGLRLATGLSFLPGVAEHSLRLGLYCAWRGDRPQAESAVERARQARIASGERGGAADAASWLAWLLVGRGDYGTAALLAEEALVVGRRLNLPGTRSRCLAALLAVATARGNTGAARKWMEEHAALSVGEPAFALAAARWWRAQGQPTRALEALEAAPATGFYATEATLERARARIANHERNTARSLLDQARASAAAGGYRELDLYGRLLRAHVEPLSAPRWAALLEEALTSPWIELFLWVLALDGDRRAQLGENARARSRFVELAARATEHGHAPLRGLAEESLRALAEGEA
jgi:tRNA A-37 threonylcarbamoyl transferase component Bud32